MKNQNEKSSLGRRNFLNGAATTAALTLLGSGTAKGREASPANTAGKSPLDDSLPVCNVCNHGGRGDGTTMNTATIQSLIDECSKAGGGIVFFPPGNYLSGTIHLKQNVNLHVSAGATIWGSTNRGDYNPGCLIYANEANNISITGRGVINGNGKSFWGQLVKEGIREEEMRQRMWRPGRMMQFVRCNKLLIEGVTIANSPAWTIHPIDCEDVTITGISMLNGVYEEDGPNTDGINPDGCSKVRISDCYLVCGDDCIVLKITDRPGGNKICRDIVVNNCVLQTTETALKIGSETYGEFRNVAFTNCVVHDSGGGVALLMRDGGLIDGMVVNNITVDCNRLKNGQGIYLWSHRRSDSTPWGSIKNVIISNMTITGGGAIFVCGAMEKRIEGLTLENIRINVLQGRSTKYHENPPYPFTAFGHRVSPHDIFCRYVDELKLRNIQLVWNSPENAKWGSAMRCWDISDLEIMGFVGRQTLGSDAAAIALRGVKGAFVHGCRAPEGTGTVLHLEAGTEQVTIIGNEFSRAKSVFALGRGVEPKEVFATGNRLPA